MFWLQRFRFEALIKKHPGRYIQHLRYKVLIKLTVQQHPGRDNSYRTGSFLVIMVKGSTIFMTMLMRMTMLYGRVTWSIWASDSFCMGEERDQLVNWDE